MLFGLKTFGQPHQKLPVQTALTIFGQPHQKLPVLSAVATFGEAHFLVYQSLNSLVSRDFLLDVLSFLLAVVSVRLVLKNSNKPINLFFPSACQLPPRTMLPNR